MATTPADIQQEIALSEAPAAEFQPLPDSRRREVFFRLPPALQESLVAGMDAG